MSIHRISKMINQDEPDGGQALGLLVLPGTHIAVLTPAAYQPGSLPGTLLAYAMGNLILRLASRLDAFSVYPIRT